MAPSLLSRSLLQRHGIADGSSEPLAGIVISVVLSMLSASALSAFTSETTILPERGLGGVLAWDSLTVGLWRWSL
jgi:hypothetical protein